MHIKGLKGPPNETVNFYYCLYYLITNLEQLFSNQSTFFVMPIKVGIIGLSTNPYSWISAAHILPLRNVPSLSSKYTVTALATSSSTTAAAAAEKWDLPSEKAYSTAADIAADPDVDLVVVGVKAPLHKELTLPALKAGKDVFVEWPLASREKEVQELVKAAKEGGSRTIVGLQLRCSPVILKVCTYVIILICQSAKFKQAKEIIDSGALGRIISTDILGIDSRVFFLPPAYDYSRDFNNGAYFLTGIHNKIVICAQANLRYVRRSKYYDSRWWTCPRLNVFSPRRIRLLKRNCKSQFPNSFYSIAY